MYDEESDTPANARTSNLNEELGQVISQLYELRSDGVCLPQRFEFSLSSNLFSKVHSVVKSFTRK
jgi:hypothetical protein